MTHTSKNTLLDFLVKMCYNTCQENRTVMGRYFFINPKLYKDK